jgi:2-isopropylmalate synthase
MEEAIRYIRDHVRGLDKAIISVHCHNDLGMATANSLSAIRAGARQIECTMNGIGERAGNAALEEVVMGVWTHGRELDVDTAIRTEMLNEMSRIVSYHTQWDVQPNKSVVGSNALRHSSGIHQHGKIKGRDNGVRVYEVFGADTVGWTGETNQLTARSGKYGVKSRLDRLGYSLSLEDVDQKVMPLFERVADERRLVDDIDLRIIMSEVSSQPVRIEYISHSIIKELADPEYEGRVHLKIDGRERKSKRISRESDSTESGSIDTLCTAVDSVLPPLADVPILVYYDSRNVGKRHSAEAEVTIVLSQNGLNNGVWDGNVGLDKQVFVGRARHADVPTASVMAYVKAMDSYLNSISPKT